MNVPEDVGDLSTNLWSGMGRGVTSTIRSSSVFQGTVKQGDPVATTRENAAGKVDTLGSLLTTNQAKEDEASSVLTESRDSP